MAKRKIEIKNYFLMLVFSIIFCTTKDNPLSTDTHNNIWLLDVTPALDKTLTLRDTIKAKVAYNFDPEKVNTRDTIFTISMLFKQRTQSIDQPAYYSEITYGSKKSKKFADTITLEYPLTEVKLINPQLKPFKISLEMSTNNYCDFDPNGKCVLTWYAQESYIYKNGLDTLK